MISTFLNWLRTPASARRAARQQYALAVQRAREPYFYTRYGVDDTVDGRFDMIALQVFLLTRAEANPDRKRLLIEEMIADMDHSLREMGVGDMSVGKKVQKIAHALNGRLRRYEESWADDDAFAQALWRNLYRGEEYKHAMAQELAVYIKTLPAHGAEAKDCA